MLIEKVGAPLCRGLAAILSVFRLDVDHGLDDLIERRRAVDQVSPRRQRTLASVFCGAYTRMTTGLAPSPTFANFFWRRFFCAQDLEKPRVEAGFTRRLGRCPLRPSPCRTGTLKVLTEVSESRFGCFIADLSITSVVTIVGMPRVLSRYVNPLRNSIYQYVKLTKGDFWNCPKSLFWRFSLSAGTVSYATE